MSGRVESRGCGRSGPSTLGLIREYAARMAALGGSERAEEH